MAQWKTIDGCSRYEVCDLGIVRNKKTKRVLHDWDNGNGYKYVRLVDDSGKAHKISVHRLVAQAFLDKPLPEQTDVDHINGIKSDNRVSNLQWVTHSQNMIKAFIIKPNSLFEGILLQATKDYVKCPELRDEIEDFLRSDYYDSMGFPVAGEVIIDILKARVL